MLVNDINLEVNSIVIVLQYWCFNFYVIFGFGKILKGILFFLNLVIIIVKIEFEGLLFFSIFFFWDKYYFKC